MLNWFIVSVKRNASLRLTNTVANIFQAEKEVELCQAEFDKQAEITRLLLEGISTTHVSVRLHSKQ